jgi:hypothetical protein
MNDVRIPLERKSVIKPGTYQVRINEVDASSFGPSGFRNIKLVYEILSSSGKPTGRQVWDNVSMSPKAAFMLDAFLDALGMDETGDMSARALKGKTLWVTIESKLYKGQKQPDVTAYLSESAMETIKPTDVEDVDPAEMETEHAAMREFTPSANLLEDDEGYDENEDALDNVLEGDDEEDVAF